MYKPCGHCDKANNKKYKCDYFKCEKPCNLAKQCKKNDEALFRVLSGERLEKLTEFQKNSEKEVE